MKSFLDAVRTAQSQYDKRMILYKLSCALLLKRRIVENIDSTFGGRVVGSPLIGAGRRGGASGALRNSVNVEYSDSDGAIIIRAGSLNVPYAAIQEFGGEITPRRAKWLTIPLHDRYRGRRAGEFSTLYFRYSKNGKKAFLFDAVYDAPAYLLKKRVTIPERPYIRPAIRAFLAKDAEELFQKYVGGSYD